ncbi:MAG TPA: HD domain-containing protein [Anaerolineales bacterium]|nr:HD domain-containing protein [Anaerolineales bacterium]
MSETETTQLTERFEDALVYASQLHSGQNRKRSQVPYIAHLLGVTSLVLEDGGDEDEAIAALLHDAVEDQGGLKTLETIRARYGERVATIVSACTDSFTEPKPPWRERKESYLEILRQSDSSVQRVSLADKVYNARSTLRDVRLEGQAAWSKFKQGKQGALWYYHAIIEALDSRSTSYLLIELKEIVEVLERTSASQAGGR